MIKIGIEIGLRVIVAMKKRDVIELLALRNIKTEITNKEKEQGSELDDSAIIALFKVMVKSREKANETFMSNDRADLAENNLLEISIMSEYLPKQMVYDDIKKAVEGIVKDKQLYKKSDMGIIMKAFAEMHPDGSRGTVSEILKNILV